MLLSALAGKEIIDVAQGVRLGLLKEADLLVDPSDGRIEALIIPVRRGWWSRGELVVPWSQVLKVGPDLIVVDLAAASPTAGIARPPGDRLRPAPQRLRTGRESVGGGNGHWRL